MKNLKSIGEFSKAHNLTTEFLKFYDKKGFVKPVWKDDRDYRYYADYQAVHFKAYNLLNRLGLSLDEADNLIKKGSLSDFIEHYDIAFEKKMQEFNELRLTLNYIESVLPNMKLISENHGWAIKELDPLVFSTSYPVGNPQDLSVENSEADSNIIALPFWRKIPPAAIAQMVELSEGTIYSLEKGNFNRTWGGIYTPEILTYCSEDISTSIYPITPTLCFVYSHRIPAEYDESKKLSDKVWDFNEPLNILRQHNLVHTGKLFQQKICVSHDQDGEFVNVTTIIPLAD